MQGRTYAHELGDRVVAIADQLVQDGADESGGSARLRRSPRARRFCARVPTCEMRSLSISRGRRCIVCSVRGWVTRS